MKEKDVYRFEYNDEIIERAGGRHLAYWAFDGILIAKKKDDGLILVDTFSLTDSTIMTVDEAEKKGKLTFLFNLNDVEEVRYYDHQYYDDNDVYILNMQHGYDTRYYIKKGAKKSQKKMLESINDKIEETKRKINFLQDELKSLLDKKEKVESGKLDIYI